jgi:carboxypeptidase family protein
VGPERRRPIGRELLLTLVLLCAAAGPSPSAGGSGDEADRLSGPPPGSVSGQVWSGEGRPLPGVRVTLGRKDEQPRSVETDAAGEYCFCRVPPARDYVLRLEKEGFAGILMNDFFVGKRRLSVFNAILRAPSEYAPSPPTGTRR